MSDDLVTIMIQEAKIQLILGHEFYGIMSCRLIDKEVSWCDTGATEGKHLFYNREFIKGLTKNELIFFVAHEVLHCVLDHIFRMGGRDPSLHNMAVDYLVNYMLVQDKVGTMPKTGLYNTEFTDAMSSEQIYRILESRSVVIEQPLDMHLDGSGADGGEGMTGKVRVTDADGSGPPILSEDEIGKIRRDILAASISAMQRAPGSIPAGVARLIDSLLTPKMNWRELLDTHIRSAIRQDYTFQRINRRSVIGGPILPSLHFEDTIKVFVAMDASGSTTKEMSTQMLSETRGIMSTFRGFQLTLASFDTELYNVTEYDESNVADVESYEVKGNGGTDFTAIYAYLKENNIVPNRLVIFTDGYPNNDDWGDAGYCPTLFVIHGNDSIVAPYGVTAHYD